MAVEAKRENARYEILGDQPVAMEIEAEEWGGEPTTLTARLINLSSQGAKLAVPHELPRDRTIRLKLAVDELGVSFYLSTRICWSAAAADGTYTIGCQLSPNVPEPVLRHVSHGARVERREDDRRPTTHEAGVIRKGFLRTKEERGVLRNFAAGGLCVEVGAAAKLGETIYVSLGKAAQIPLVEVIVRWQLQEGNRYLLGCEYADAGSFAMLSSILK